MAFQLTFHQRPDIRAPLFQVDVLDPGSVTPGYWFVAPYAYIIQDKFARRYYQPCQTGPAIYDNNGVSLGPVKVSSKIRSLTRSDLLGSCVDRSLHDCESERMRFQSLGVQQLIRTFFNPLVLW